MSNIDLGAYPLDRFLADLGMSRSSYCEHVKRGRLPAPFRIGKRSYVDPAAQRAAIQALKAQTEAA